MHRCCFKITSATNVTTILACLNLIKCNQMLNVSKTGTKNLNQMKRLHIWLKRQSTMHHQSIKKEILRSIKLIIGPEKKSSFLQLHLLQIYVKRSWQISVLILLLRCLKKLSDVENISLLKVDGVTRKARSNSFDLVKELKGPILAPGCSSVCFTCVEFLQKGKIPILALANGLWVGEIPNELQELTYAEQLLIARVRHNRCIVKVSSGMYKMHANAISFSNPMPKIYNVLPPPIEEMDEVLAFIYTGPCKPTKADFKRTP